MDDEAVVVMQEYGQTDAAMQGKVQVSALIASNNSKSLLKRGSHQPQAAVQMSQIYPAGRNSEDTRNMKRSLDQGSQSVRVKGQLGGTRAS